MQIHYCATSAAIPSSLSDFSFACCFNDATDSLEQIMSFFSKRSLRNIKWNSGKTFNTTIWNLNILWMGADKVFKNNTFRDRFEILLLILKRNNSMVLFYGWGLTVSMLHSLYEETVYFLQLNFQDFLWSFGSHPSMKGWVDLGANQRFWARDQWTGNPAP